MIRKFNVFIIFFILVQFGCAHKEKQTAINAVLKKNQDKLIPCYPKNQKLGDGGDVEISMFIDYSGKVNQDKVSIASSTLKDPATETCLMNALRFLTWDNVGEPGVETDLRITFDLKAEI